MDHQADQDIGRAVDIPGRAYGRGGLDNVPIAVKTGYRFDVGIELFPGLGRPGYTGVVQNIFVVIKGERIDVKRQRIDPVRINQVLGGNVNKLVLKVPDGHRRFVSRKHLRHRRYFITMLR